MFSADRQGTDGFKLRVALKVFSPEPYRDDESYCVDMARIADIARPVAIGQHDNLVIVQNFVEHEGIRVMEMECIDGFDLRQILSSAILEFTRRHTAPAAWEYIQRLS